MSVSLKTEFFRKQAIPSADNCYSGVSVKVEPVFFSKKFIIQEVMGEVEHGEEAMLPIEQIVEEEANRGRFSRQRNPPDSEKIQQSV